MTVAATEIRTKFVDFDARRDPKTQHWCLRCQRDLKPGQPFRSVAVVDCSFAVHPDGPQPEQHLIAVWALGMDCAKILGLEWTREPYEVAQ